MMVLLMKGEGGEKQTILGDAQISDGDYFCLRLMAKKITV